MEMPKFCGLSMYIEINVKNYSLIYKKICRIRNRILCNLLASGRVQLNFTYVIFKID